MPEATETMFNWEKASQEQIESVLNILLPGFDPTEFTPKGLRKRIGIKAKGKSPEEIISAYNTRVEKTKTSISDEIKGLTPAEIQDVLSRLGSNIQVGERYTGDELWKAQRLIDTKLKRKGLTLAEAKVMERKAISTGTGGRRGRFTLLPTELTNLTTPLGFPQLVAEFFSKIAQSDPAAKFGRAESVRPLAVCKSPALLGTNVIYISLGKEYKLPESMLKKRAPKVAAVSA